MSFQLQNVEVEVDTEQGCVSAVRKYLADIGFDIPFDANIFIKDWLPTRKTGRFWIEFDVEKNTADMMESQRRTGNLEKWNEKTFGNQKDLYVALKSVHNYVSESGTSSQPADSTSEERVKPEPIDPDDPPVIVKTEVSEIVPMGVGVNSEDTSARFEAFGEYQENYEDNGWAYQETDCSDILKTFPFLFRIECLPLEFGMMQEAAVTQFLAKLGLPANVSFGIFSFVEHPSTSESSPRFDVEIAVGEGTRDTLQSSSVRLALLLLNEQKSLKETSEYMSLSPIATPRERAIKEVLTGVCGLLNSGKALEKFQAIVKEKTIVITQINKPTTELTIDDVYKCYRDEYMEIVTNCSDETYSEMKTWLEEEEVAHSLQNEVEHKPEPRVLPTTHVDGAMEIMNNVCNELNRDKIKSEFHAVARHNVIMLYEPKKPTVKVSIEKVEKRFPKEYRAAMKIYNGKDKMQMKTLWKEAPSVIWKAKLAERDPLLHALNEMMAAMCALMNVGKVKTEWNAHFNRGQIHVARFRRKTESYTLKEAFRKMPDYYRGARKRCNAAVLRELRKWEAANGIAVKRTAERANEGPVVKMPR